MNEAEEIKQLQERLDELKGELKQHWGQIQALQQRISILNGHQPNQIATVRSKRTESFSLENFIGLRLIHFIGIIVLVAGLSIGVKYAIDRNLVSETMRIGLAYAAGCILYFLSFRLRKKYNLFSAILFSGAVASAYFTTYAACIYYSMFGFVPAFSIMIALTVFTVYQAISYNREEIALLSMTGAYGIPFLISKNAEQVDLFFLYISVINSGVVFLSIKKIWKNTGRLAETITWILFIGWATTRFDVKFQWVGIFFLVLFFLMFLFTSLAFRIVHKQSLTKNDSLQIVLNNLAFYFGTLVVFQMKLLNTDIAVIMLVLSVFTAAQTICFHYFLKNEAVVERMLVILSLALFVSFIGFNWDGFTVSLLWLLTAVAVFIFGFFLRSTMIRMMAMILVGITLAKLLLFDSQRFTTIQKVIAYLVLGILLLIGSFFYQKFKQQLFGEEAEE